MDLIKNNPSLLPLLFFPLLHSLCLAQQQGPAYQGFVFNATEFPSDDDYDYIIVGGGTAGCPLAATLSQSHRVLVLERGNHILEHPNLLTQEGFLQTLTQVDAYDSPAEPFTSEDGVQNARGRVLGGSSAINAGFYSRADQDFFRQSSRFNWDLDLVNESYEWVEKTVVFRPELGSPPSAMGFSKPTSCPTMASTSTPLSEPRSVAPHLIAMVGDSAADFLTQASPFHIRIALHASVERILLNTVSTSSTGSSGRAKQAAATGVVYRDREGRQHRAMVRKKGEVIVCAGALGSPQLLLLSGIGPRRYLSSWGIPVSHHLPC